MADKICGSNHIRARAFEQKFNTSVKALAENMLLSKHSFKVWLVNSCSLVNVNYYHKTIS